MFNRLVDMIGPYGGTKESEFLRPIKLAIAAIVTLLTMLSGLVGIIILAGDFTGPVLLVATTLLSKRRLSKEQEKANNYLYAFSVLLTVYTIYIGGFPVGYQVGDGRLWIWLDQMGSFAIPAWIDLFRWLIIFLISGSEIILTFLMSRLLTEIIHPSLPNSIRAKPGRLAKVLPYMQIANDDEIEFEDEDSVIPEGNDVAPWR